MPMFLSEDNISELWEGININPRFAYKDLFPLDASYTYMPWDVILKGILDILIFHLAAGCSVSLL